MIQNGTLTVVSFNMRGIPFSHPSPLLRAAKIGEAVEAMGTDVLNLQEVYTYRLVRALRKALPSLPFISLKRGVIGPAGGLITLSRLPVQTTVFHSLFSVTRQFHSRALPAITPGGKGALVTWLAGQSTVIINAHLSPNKDGEWLATNRFWPLHQAQLGAMASLVQQPRIRNADVAVLSGDFNVARDCSLYTDFAAHCGMQDAFTGTPAPTFHPEFLDGRSPHCIDYVWVGGYYTVTEGSHVLAEKVELADGMYDFLSDHIGLRATLVRS